MSTLNMEELQVYVEEKVHHLYSRRLETVTGLSVNELVSQTPFLFRAKEISAAPQLVEETLQTFLSHFDNEQFGKLLENLAVFIALKTTGGHLSNFAGIDLEYEDRGAFRVMSIKSGLDSKNSIQLEKLATDFADAELQLRQTGHIIPIQKVLGICYGKAGTILTNSGYLKITGQNFWTLISGDPNLYAEVIGLIGCKAHEHNQAFKYQLDGTINLLTKQFIERYCTTDGVIDWPRLLKANSGNFDLDTFFGKSQ